MPLLGMIACSNRLFHWSVLKSTIGCALRKTATGKSFSTKKESTAAVINFMSTTDLPHHFGGHTQKGFEHVEDVFRENFLNGWEAAGASFAAYRNGHLIIDLWGGYSNTENGTPWQQNTMNSLYSTTKSISALTFAKLIDQNLASYEDLVTKFWPAYGKNGKENTTINMLLLHQAGLPYLDRVYGMEDVKCAQRMSELIENQGPVWIPGTKSGYHTLTIGFLLDQLARRIDPKGRGIAQQFREEVKNTNGIDDIYIGLPRNLNNRVSNVQMYSEEDLMRESAVNQTVMKHYIQGKNEYHTKMLANTPWLLALDYNQPHIREMEIPAANGIGTARSLAKVHSLLVEGKFLGSQTIDMLRQPLLIDELDVVNGYPECKGHGFQYTKNLQGSWIFGHSGLGGQNVRIDLENKLAFAYLCNGLKAGDSDDTGTFYKLKCALYECLALND